MESETTGGANKISQADADQKAQENGFIHDQSSQSRGVRNSFSDTFASRSGGFAVADKCRSVTWETFPINSCDAYKTQPKYMQDRTKMASSETICDKEEFTGSDALCDPEACSEESHTFYGSSDSTKTVKTEIFIKSNGSSRKNVHSWPVGPEMTKSALLLNKAAASSSLETESQKQERQSGKHYDRSKRKSAPTGGKSLRGKSFSEENGAMETGTSAPAAKSSTRNGAKKETGKSLALQVHHTSSTEYKDKEDILPKSPSGGLTTPSDKYSDTTSQDGENKFLKGGTRALLIQKVSAFMI